MLKVFFYFMGVILSIDQGTTGTRSMLFNSKGESLGKSYQEHEQIFPSPGWVEHDANEIWVKTLQTIKEVVTKTKIDFSQIASIGITNQRETIVAWDKTTGIPVHNAIVWQCRRTSDLCDKLKDEGYANLFKTRTGLVIDPYFSGTKIKWLLENSEKAKDKASKNELLVGTIDSWLIWKLTGNHITDYSNASRTLLFNIHSGSWDKDLLEILDIPLDILPDIRPSSDKETYGTTKNKLLSCSIPVAGNAGDQQAALFGQTCFDVGDVKNTYGTGNFMLMNTGDKIVNSENGLQTTIAWKIDDKINYALEGSVFITGAAIQWIEYGINILENKDQLSEIMETTPSTEGVYFVPAFVGLGAPYWDPYARGTLLGLTRGTTREHIIRATLESICYQSEDIFKIMKNDSGTGIKMLRVDGGVTNCQPLLQFQANISNVSVQKTIVNETTALGAAYLAGLAVDYWNDFNDIKANYQIEKEFKPSMTENMRNSLLEDWKKAVNRSLSWINS